MFMFIIFGKPLRFAFEVIELAFVSLSSSITSSIASSSRGSVSVVCMFTDSGELCSAISSRCSGVTPTRAAGSSCSLGVAAPLVSTPTPASDE